MIVSFCLNYFFLSHLNLSTAVTNERKKKVTLWCEASYLSQALQFNSMARRLYGFLGKNTQHFIRPEATHTYNYNSSLLKCIDCVEFSRLSGYCAVFYFQPLSSPSLTELLLLLLFRAIAFLLYAIFVNIVRAYFNTTKYKLTQS